MVDHKQDILTATGSHRAWIGERRADSSVMGVPVHSNPLLPGTLLPGAARPSAGLREGVRNWNRPQATSSTNARHAAITRTLANFPSYKSWTEKVKTTWGKDKPE